MSEMNNYELFTQNAMDFLSTRPEYEALVRDTDLGNSNLMFTNDNRMIEIWDGLASDEHTNESFAWTMKNCQDLIINTMVNNINDYTQVNNILVDNQNCANDNPINNMINYTIDEYDDNQMDVADTINDDDTIGDDDTINDDDTIIDSSICDSGICDSSIGDDFDFEEHAREIERHVDTEDCMCTICRNCVDHRYSNIRPPMLTRQPSTIAPNYDEGGIWSHNITEPKFDEDDIWSFNNIEEPTEPPPSIPTLSRQPSEMLYEELNPYAFPWLPQTNTQPFLTRQSSSVQPVPRQPSEDEQPQTFDM
tara:strand:+ start:219 stop:1139 length:921 start_codon:yes stop_codon:yes gene_type:complete